MFNQQAAQIIWDEVNRAKECGYAGVVFDDPYSVRGEVWVSDAKDSVTFFGTKQRYPSSVWPDLPQVFWLLDRLATSNGYPKMVRSTCESFWWNSPPKITLLVLFAGRDSHPNGLLFVEQCLHRVDEIMGLLQAPLERVVS